MDEHVADLEEVGLEARERERVHAVAEVVAHAGMVVLVEVADGDPLAEEGGVEEAHEPAAAADGRGGVGGGGDLSRRLLRPEAQAPQPEKPHHGRRGLGPNPISKLYSPPPPPAPPPPTRLPPPLTTITSRLGAARSSNPPQSEGTTTKSKPYPPRGPGIRSFPNPSLEITSRFAARRCGIGRGRRGRAARARGDRQGWGVCAGSIRFGWIRFELSQRFRRWVWETLI